MATLSADEEALLKALQAKLAAPAVETKLFNDAGDVLRYLVDNFPGFSANPEQRSEAHAAVDATFPPANSASASTAETTTSS